MALTKRAICQECKKETTIIIDFTKKNNSICPACTLKANEQAKQEYLNELKMLSIEERLARIEKWLYKYESTSKIRS